MFFNTMKPNNKAHTTSNKFDFSIPEHYWQIIIAVITLVLFSLNYVRIFDNVFWGDEAYSIRLMKKSLSEMLQATANDVHPPLYYILLMLLYHVLGAHGWVYHLSALIPYAILLFFSCTILFKSFGKETALLFNTFISLLYNSTVYNVEVRMYSLSALLLVLAFYGYYLIFKESDNIKGYLIFTLSSIAVAYTHYYCIVSVSVFYIALFILFIMKKVRLSRLFTVYGITIVGYLPWLATLLKAAKRTSDDFWMTSIPSIQNSLLYFFYSKNTFFSVIMFTLTLILVVFLNTESSDYCFLIPCVLSAPFSILVGNVASALIRPVFLNRYIYGASVLFCLAFCITISSLKRKGIMSIIIIAFTLFSCLPSYIETYRNEKTDDRRTAYTLEKMTENGVPDGTVLTNNSFFSWTIFEYYVPGIPCQQASLDNIEFMDSTVYYLAWSNALSETENDQLSKRGYAAELIISDGFLGSSNFYLYKVIKV